MYSLLSPGIQSLSHILLMCISIHLSRKHCAKYTVHAGKALAMDGFLTVFGLLCARCSALYIALVFTAAKRYHDNDNSHEENI